MLQIPDWGPFSDGGIITCECYNPARLPAIQLGDKETLRKEHPCGGFEWEVVRLGADIGLVCLTCKHRVMLSRRELNRRLKKHTPKVDSSDINS